MYRLKIRYILAILIGFSAVFCACTIPVKKAVGQEETGAVLPPPSTEVTRENEEDYETKLYAGVFADFKKSIIDAGIIPSNIAELKLTPEEQSTLVYSFLQGPMSYGEGLPWAGDWSEKVISSRRFGGFGCGFCCMANIYSTLTDYECSPWDMMEYAISITKYYPYAESGAIDWPEIRRTLRSTGFQCKYYKKTETYEEFQEYIQNSKSAIVLVSSANDRAFWENTAGHYVTIWLYQKDTDTVFLTEPGDPTKNRTWIPLRYVYDALKTANRYQFLTVTAYSEEENTWKGNGIDDVWNGKY